MSCVLSLAFCVAFAMALGVADPLVNQMTILKPPLWYRQAEQCCNHELSLRDADEHTYDGQLLTECFHEHNSASPYATCEPDLCFAIKKGYASVDGAIRKETLQILLEVEFENNPETLQKVVADCLYGDLFKYPVDVCEMKRLNMCISVHIQEEVLRGCKDWKDNFLCLKMRLDVSRNVRFFISLIIHMLYTILDKNTTSAELPKESSPLTLLLSLCDATREDRSAAEQLEQEEEVSLALKELN